MCMTTTRSLDELKTIYMSIVENMLTENMDVILGTTDALINKTGEAETKYKDLQTLCAEKMKAQITEEEYKLLQPHIIDMIAEVSRLVLLHLKEQK